MILVAGATGTTGGEVVRLLQEQGEPFTAMVRSAAKAEALQAAGIDTVVADLADRASLGLAMKGAESLFLLSASVADQADLQLNAVEAAEKASVGFIVKVSALGADPDSPLALGRAHADVEEGLAASGIPHAILRAGSFMQNFLGSAETIRDQDQFYGSSRDGKIAMIDARDIAAALPRPFEAAATSATWSLIPRSMIPPPCDVGQIELDSPIIWGGRIPRSDLPKGGIHGAQDFTSAFDRPLRCAAN